MTLANAGNPLLSRPNLTAPEIVAVRLAAQINNCCGRVNIPAF
jgi:hypothetical protein